MALNLNDGPGDAEIFKSASTQKGCSLPQVAELSGKVGLNYQMAFRNPGAGFLVPSVVHWKVGHYAALVRKAGDLYELQDPTFGNKTWATKEALEAETSGYFLVAAGALPAGWRAVDEKEGATVWGKGLTVRNDPQHICVERPGHRRHVSGARHWHGGRQGSFDGRQPKPNRQPVGYAPPVGPAVTFTVRYNQRDGLFQPANFNYGNLGPQWTSDWFTYITDNPTNILADVNLYVGGGGQRTYTGLNTNTQAYAYQQYDRNLLTRTGPSSYQFLSGDGSKMIFSESDGSVGTSRNIFLTQKIDPQGNALTFTYDTNLCLVAVTDAIGQVTTLTYGLAERVIDPDDVVPADIYKLTKVTDPFGRSATLDYQPFVVAKTVTEIDLNGTISYLTTLDYAWRLATITDEIGLTSQIGWADNLVAYRVVGSITYYADSYTLNSLTTPYGTTTFSGVDNGQYPLDGNCVSRMEAASGWNTIKGIRTSPCLTRLPACLQAC